MPNKRDPSEERESPFFIDDECPDCDTELVLYDKLDDEKRAESDWLTDPEFYDGESIWYDEWVCPNCLDGIILDWDEEFKEKKFEEWTENVESEEFTPVEDVIEEAAEGDEMLDAEISETVLENQPDE